MLCGPWVRTSLYCSMAARGLAAVNKAPAEIDSGGEPLRIERERAFIRFDRGLEGQVLVVAVSSIVVGLGDQGRISEA